MAANFAAYFLDRYKLIKSGGTTKAYTILPGIETELEKYETPLKMKSKYNDELSIKHPLSDWSPPLINEIIEKYICIKSCICKCPILCICCEACSNC